MLPTLNDFDYDLPEERIAQKPAEKRDESRLMVLHRGRGVEHRAFRDLPDLLQSGDVLVVNDTRVLPAKFSLRRDTGGRVEGLYIHGREGGQWEVLLRNARRCRIGERLGFEGHPDQGLVLEESLGRGEWLVRPDPPVEAEDILPHVGSTPLPPYIHRTTGDDDSSDRQRYQTIFAQRPGAVAAPTAGLHFTDAILEELRRRDMEIARVTLHVGLGTFSPVEVEDLPSHNMHSEYFELPAATVDCIRRARSEGRRIIAVGTTSVRVLESAARKYEGSLAETSGWTDLFLYPPAGFHIVDAMITNFHLPRSTLLMLVAAFCDPGGTNGTAEILDAYRQAVQEKYRFFSYGDAMLID